MLSHSKSLVPLFGRYYSTSVITGGFKIVGNNIYQKQQQFSLSLSTSSTNLCKSSISKNYIVNSNNNNRFLNKYYSKREFEDEEYDEDEDENEEFDDNEDGERRERNYYKRSLDGDVDGRRDKEDIQKYIDMVIPEQVMENQGIQFLLAEIHEANLNYPLPLYKEVKYQIHKLHKQDPTFWDIDKIAKVFKLLPARVVALIKFVDLEEEERRKGTRLYYEFDDEYEEAYGVRLDDSEQIDELRDIEKDKKNKKKKDDFALQDTHYSPERLHLGKKFKRYHPKLRSAASGSKPDPLHEVPTEIPANYPEKSVYFRGPTFVVPRKKNVIFVDTSKDRFTKKSNPDPMVLIQGIDGSLRTPSSEEKVLILNKVKAKKVHRDPHTLLNKPFPITSSPLNIELEESVDKALEAITEDIILPKSKEQKDEETAAA